MPIVFEFAGAKVYMYYQDHLPPHVHIRGNGIEAMVSIPDGQVLSGKLPNSLRAEIAEWVRLYQDQLMANWQKARQGFPVSRIIEDQR